MPDLTHGETLDLVHLCTYGDIGGASRATYRLHKGLLELGMRSRLLVGRSAVADPSVIPVNAGWRGVAKRKLCSGLNEGAKQLYAVRPGRNFSINLGREFSLSGHPIIRNADVLTLYWVGNGFFNPSLLKSFHKPVVWRLSDTWPLTGGCHYPGDCLGYLGACGGCPQLGRAGENDLSRKGWSSKKEAYRSANLTVVAPSRWIADLARESSLLGDKQIVHIPTGVRTDLFKPMDRDALRQKYGLDPKVPYVLFGAMEALGNPRKGPEILNEALGLLAHAGRDLELLVFGSDGTDQTHLDHFRTHYLGRIREEERLAEIYNLASVFVAPSLEENLANTVLESLSCGTPCVAFNVGGMPDMIRHRENGVLVEEIEPSGLATGIDWVLSHGDWQQLSSRSRQQMLENFGMEQQASRFLALYRTLLIAGE